MPPIRNYFHRLCCAFGLAGLWIFCAPESAVAQDFERTDGLYVSRPEQWLSAEEWAYPLTDTVLFESATAYLSDLFERVRYSLPVTFARRGEVRRWGQDELYATAGRSVLRLVGVTESFDPLCGRVFRWSGDTTDWHTASVAATTHRYRTMVRWAWRGSVGRGWRGSAALETRFGRDAVERGIFQESIEAATRWNKIFGRGSELQLAAVVPITTRGGRRPATAEAYLLTGDRHYNPAWGFQRGRERNASVRRERMPSLGVRWNSRPSASVQLRLSADAEAGVRKQSGLGWYDAATPMPDYYRYMPSYADEPIAEAAWRNADPRYTQIDWDELIRCNRMQGGAARYYLEDRVTRVVNLRLCAEVGGALSRTWSWRGGVMTEYRNHRNYKEMSDLLGATYLVDWDCFLVDGLAVSNRAQNDLRHPDRRITQGDRFGYDYTIQETEIKAFAQLEGAFGSTNIQARIECGGASVQRIGHYEKEIFAGSASYGASRRVRMSPLRLAVELERRMASRGVLLASAVWALTPPEAEELFYQPQYNNRLVERPEEQQTAALDLSYRLQGRNWMWHSSLFGLYQGHGLHTTRYYDDTEGVFSDLYVSRINTLHYGLETAVEYRPTPQWLLTAGLAWTEGRYVGNPRLTIRADDDNRLIEQGLVSHMEHCRPARTPRLAAGATLQFEGASGWGFRLTASYVGGRWVEASPLRRSDRLMAQQGATPEAAEAFMHQERLADLCRLDGSIFKHFHIRSVRMTALLEVDRLTNQRAYASGYESLRVVRRRVGALYYGMPQATRYTPLAGRSLTLRLTAHF